jgi:hypothetical protein
MFGMHECVCARVSVAGRGMLHAACKYKKLVLHYGLLNDFLMTSRDAKSSLV